MSGPDDWAAMTQQYARGRQVPQATGGDPSRAPRILAKIKRAWEARPNLGLGPLLIEATGGHLARPNYLRAMSDAELEMLLDQFLAGIPPAPGG